MAKVRALATSCKIRRQRHNYFFLSKRHRAALVETKNCGYFHQQGGRQSVFTQELLRSCNEETVQVGAMPSGCSRWCAFSQQVASPALMPPRISDSAVSPTISTRERSRIARLFQRIIENFLTRFGNANLFGNHQQIEVITQARAFRTHLLQGAKAVGDDADFGVATNGVKRETAPGSGVQISAIALIKASLSKPASTFEPFGPALKTPVLKL